MKIGQAVLEEFGDIHFPYCDTRFLYIRLKKIKNASQLQNYHLP